MSFVDKYEAMMGKRDKDTALALIDHFFEAGGNIIDTANLYQGNNRKRGWESGWRCGRTGTRR